MQQILIVDEQDNVIGEGDKEKCHDGSGILHRAFLAMVFNGAGELYLTRRSGKKRLWPGFWDGTVASHVLRGEDYEQASRRRLAEEIGLTTGDVTYLFKFQYRVGYMDIGAENEICAVTATKSVEAAMLIPDPEEISEIKVIDLQSLVRDMQVNGHIYAPWLVLAVEHMAERNLLWSRP